MRRGYGAEDIDGALARLEELGYLDDAAYARALVSRRSGDRGRRAIAAELTAKGIARPVVATALSELGDDEEVIAANRLLRRRSAVEGPEKTLARLARRGFSPDVIAKAWRIG